MGYHADLTGADLHESKGTSTANADEVFVADGLGSGSYKRISQVELPHAYIEFTGNSTPLSVASNTYTKITGFTALEADGITFASNTLTITRSGHYLVLGQLSVTGGNADVYNLDAFVNNSAAGQMVAWKFNSAGDTVSVSYMAYLELSASNTLDFYIKNTTDGDDPTITNASFFVRIVHE